MKKIMSSRFLNSSPAPISLGLGKISSTSKYFARLPGNLGMFIFCIYLGFLSACSSDTIQTSVNRPNIIILLADDMGYSDLGCMGSEMETPNLDRLASAGVLMTHFYTTSRCCPSRASLMTGQYAHRVGMGHMNYDWDLPSYRGFLTNGSVTIPEVLKGAGYQTLMTGKWHIGDERPNWPLDRGFDRFYGIPAGGGVYFWPPVGLERPVFLDEKQIEPDADWYSTDAFTDYAITFIKDANEAQVPFFLYTAYIAPHFPLQAWEEDIQKYQGKYDDGFEKIQQARFEKQQQLGVLPTGLMLPPPDYDDWSHVQNPKHQARMMEVYAAMVDRLDQNVGKLIQVLENEGILDNTLILFFSDNGGCPNARNDTPEIEPGNRNSFVAYGKSWANVSNTPYRLYKAMEHEGGLLTPLIAHWPEGLNQPGLITHEPAHIIDIMAICLEVTGADYPQEFRGEAVPEMVGLSFLPQLQGESAPPDRWLFWEHEGNKAVRRGSWKLVKRHKQEWELYDLSKDPTELNNHSTLHPDKMAEMTAAYESWANAHGIKDWPVPH